MLQGCIYFHACKIKPFVTVDYTVYKNNRDMSFWGSFQGAASKIQYLSFASSIIYTKF